MSSSRITLVRMWVLLCLLPSARPGLARAQEPTPAQSEAPVRAPQAEQDGDGQARHQPPQAAVDHYLLGRRAYLAGRYRDALVELKAALEYDPSSPDLLYNVARVYENLSEFDQAIDYYQRYMAKLPPEASDERDKTEKTIRRLQGAKHEIAVRPATPPPPPTRVSIGRADAAFWLTGGAACAMFAGAAVTGVLALKTAHQVSSFVVGSTGTLAERDKLKTRADRFALASDIALGAGAATLTAAALLFFLRDGDPIPEREPSTRLGAHFDGRRAELTLSGSF